MAHKKRKSHKRKTAKRNPPMQMVTYKKPSTQTNPRRPDLAKMFLPDRPTQWGAAFFGLIGGNYAANFIEKRFMTRMRNVPPWMKRVLVGMGGVGVTSMLSGVKGMGPIVKDIKNGIWTSVAIETFNGMITPRPPAVPTEQQEFLRIGQDDLENEIDNDLDEYETDESILETGQDDLNEMLEREINEEISGPRHIVSAENNRHIVSADNMEEGEGRHIVSADQLSPIGQFSPDD